MVWCGGVFCIAGKGLLRAVVKWVIVLTQPSSTIILAQVIL